MERIADSRGEKQIGWDLSTIQKWEQTPISLHKVHLGVAVFFELCYKVVDGAQAPATL
ncbi:hypothetical protein KKF84_17820 [Myxococcota bacterium]|nr:hypothetical protein [Myxococcota bacterium]